MGVNLQILIRLKLFNLEILIRVRSIFFIAQYSGNNFYSYFCNGT